MWSVAEIWNNSLLTFDTRSPEPRDYMYASEIGGAFIDRWMKMKGKKYSNPPNERSQRKFQAGNIWEWIIGFVLKRAGLKVDRQTKLQNQLPGCLLVSGKLDYLTGGKPDWDFAEQQVKSLDLPEFLYYASMQIIGQLRAKYANDELEEVITEVKSLGSFVFDKLEASNKPLYHHGAQTYFYVMTYSGLIKTPTPGKIFYVCRDDCRMKEMNIRFTDKDYLDAYRLDVEQMTEYWRSSKRPPLEKEFTFDEDTFKFRHNWLVEYSNYLTLLYGYKTPQEYRDKYTKLTTQYNRVFKRCVDCQTMTKMNLDVIKEIKKNKEFKRFDEWVEKAKIAKAKGLLEMEETEEAAA